MTGTGQGVDLDYTLYVFADSSVMATCQVGDGFAQVTGVSLFRSNQAGAAGGGCSIRWDVDTATAGWWDFVVNPARTSMTATYHDVGSQYDARNFTFTCAKS